MDKLDAEEIFNKFNSGIANETEQRQLENWMLEYRANEQSGLSEKELKNLSERIWNNISMDLVPVSKPALLLRKVAIAASIAIVLAAGGFYFYQRNQSANTEITTKNDIAPGGNKAFLTLADGKRIILTDAKTGELAEQSGVKITKAADGQLIYTISNLPNENTKINNYNTIETPRGGTYQVRLPDGTKVWLNAASTIKYPVSFSSQKERRITLLSGEAYFEVAKDKKHPFIVHTDQQEVKVLGTHFNISNYNDEQSTKTTLIEGSVSVTSLRHPEFISGSRKREGVILKPGEQSLNNGGEIGITKVDTESVIGWKEGDFIFENQELITTMRQISRWYDVDVTYENGAPIRLKLGGLIPRSNPISATLKAMEATGKVKFKFEGRRIIVLKK